MKLWTVCVCLSAVCAYAGGVAEALTNQELFDIISPNAEDIEDYNPDESTSSENADDNADELTFPGGPDDEVDIEYLMVALGNLQEEDDSLEEAESRGLAWWHRKHRKHRKHRRQRPKFSCHCHHGGCGCCAEHTWTFHLIYKRFRKHIKACIQLNYLRKKFGFEFTFTVNGHRLYHKEISLKHPPSMCMGLPGFSRVASACLQIYNVNMRTKHVCVRLTGALDFKFKKFKFHLKLGCFNIPMLEDGMQFNLGPDAIKMWEEQADDGDDVGGVDLTEKFRELQNWEE